MYGNPFGWPMLNRPAYGFAPRFAQPFATSGLMAEFLVPSPPPPPVRGGLLDPTAWAQFREREARRMAADPIPDELRGIDGGLFGALKRQFWPEEAGEAGVESPMRSPMGGYGSVVPWSSLATGAPARVHESVPPAGSQTQAPAGVRCDPPTLRADPERC